MLDEYKEFAEYTCLLNGEDYPLRLNPEDLKGNDKGYNDVTFKFGGIRRALTIIARYAYYTENITNPNDIMYLFECWCGFSTEENSVKVKLLEKEAFKYLKNWLPTYIAQIPKRFPNKIFPADKICNDLINRKEMWEESIFSSEAEDLKKNKIYFDEIIADAIQRGKLRKCYLSVKPIENSKLNKHYLSKYYKLVSAYLMECNKERDYVLIDNTAYANWVHEGCDYRKKINSNVITKFQFTYTEKEQEDGKERNKTIPVFKYEFHPLTNNIKYYFIEQAWLKEFEPSVGEYTDETEIKQTPGFVYFVDDGCMKPLRQLDMVNSDETGNVNKKRGRKRKSEDNNEDTFAPDKDSETAQTISILTAVAGKNSPTSIGGEMNLRLGNGSQ